MSDGVLQVNLEPSPTQEEAMLSRALEVAVMAPRGEGKTDWGLMDMTYHASIQDKKYRPIPWAICRDTWKNIERTTYRSIMYPTNPKSLAYQIRDRLRERDSGKEISLVDRKGDTIWTAFLFGMETPQDYDKLQSLQLGGLWLEEPAPAMQEEIGKGLPEEAWTIGITSLRHPLMGEKSSEWLTREMGGKFTLHQWTPSEIRQGLLLGVLTRDFHGELLVRDRKAQLTENYPSEDHWTWVRFFEEAHPDRALFRIPAGENIHVDQQYRENMAKALVGRQDLLDRLVIGRPAHVQLGISVTPEYHETLNGGSWHRSDKTFDPMPNIPVLRFWDGDLHPSPYSQDTEILTKNGWECVSDVKVGDTVITLNPDTREIEYSKIIDTVHRLHTGDMYHWKGQNYDLRVTDDHSVPYITAKGKINPFRRAKDSGRSVKMLKSGKWQGSFSFEFGLITTEGELMIHENSYVYLPPYKSKKKYYKQYKQVKINLNTFCAFMGLYLSEGGCSNYKKRSTDTDADHYEVAIWQKERDPRMEHILNELPFKWTWIKRGWKCHSVQLYTYLKRFGTSFQKSVPKIIKELPPKYLEIFTKYYMMGDGSEERRIYTTSKQIVDDFQEIALKLGKRATYRISRDAGHVTKIRGVTVHVNKPQYVINFANKSKTLTLTTKTIEKVKDEPVYCVVAEKNHIIYVRRNGKPMWGGNCFFAQITPRGKFIGLDTLRAPQTGMGMKQFIDTFVKPLIQNRYYMMRKWRDLGDPTLRDRDSSDSSQTAAGMIEHELNTTYEPGVLRWGPRKEALKDLLTRTLSDGEPMFTLSKHEKIMHRSLSGGWHYNKSSSGKVSEEPDNDDINSHPAAALSHGLAKIFKYERETRIVFPSDKKRKIAVSSSVQPLFQHGR